MFVPVICKATGSPSAPGSPPARSYERRVRGDVAYEGQWWAVRRLPDLKVFVKGFPRSFDEKGVTLRLKIEDGSSR